MNEKGEREPPCPRPHDAGKRSFGVPLIGTERWDEAKHRESKPSI